MKLWQAMLVAGAAWVGTVGAGALRANDVETEPDVATEAVEDTDDAAADVAEVESAPQDAATDAADADAPETADASPDAPKTAGPSSTPEIDALIKQLGAEDFNDREAAVAKLKALGETALPALKKARESSDPEVAGRAEVAVRDLVSPPQPARLPGSRRGRVVGGAVGVRVHMAFENGRRRVEVEEHGRTIHISEGPDGIQMSVTGQIDGEEVTRDFAARTPDELRRQNPEAFEVYDRFAGRGGAQVQGHRMIMPGRVFVRPGGGVARIGPPPGADDAFDGEEVPEDIKQLRAMIERQMNEAQRPEAQRREIAGMLEQLREARERDPLADQRQIHRQMDQFNNRADALRDRLKDLKLPDPGDALPPPPATRLGIEVLEDPDEGVTVLHVIPEGRAQKLGVEPLDVITKVNGQPVGDAKDLRRAVTEAKGQLVIEGTRDGEPLKLEEKAAAEKPAEVKP